MAPVPGTSDDGPPDATRAGLRRLLASFPGTTVPPWVRQALLDGVGGVVLFAENTPDLITTRRLCDELHAIAPDVLIMVDEEGGDVSRLEAVTGSSIPGNAALGVLDDVATTGRVGRALGALLHAVGIDIDLAPCLDVASQPRNPVIGTRSFGADAQLVARHGDAFVRGMAEGGVAACAKHYPGHGATEVDSHAGLPVLDVGLAELEARDGLPFRTAVAAGLEAVMTAHVVVPELGPDPASLSAWSSQRLRTDGFDGLIITDALGMRAVGDDLGRAAVAAVAAGADLLCLDAPHERDAELAFRQALDALTAAFADGTLDLAATAEADRRVAVAAAAARRRRKQPRVDVDTALTALAEAGRDAARRALRTTGSPVLMPPVALVDLRGRQNLAAGRTTSAFQSALDDRLRRLGEPPARRLDPAADDLDRAGAVLVLTREPYPEAAEGRALAALLERCPSAVVVHTGLPAVAPHVPTRVDCHGVGRANAEAVAELLLPVPAEPSR
ncbi:glycoside hydrolase family 3 protein [Desertihabitans brevis]|uniref:Glycoside hydrolase family 3 protein n=1 Tax=Desertihabitans brevis TaxID=2268447 RepID=A0A367YXW5_9ACTN|nr:glycoside hydrolase family 3 protein [Desertihabitans brevis]